MENLNVIVCSDALAYLKSLPDKCVHTIVTSPPYYKLRDYNVKGQLGLEKTPEEYVVALVEILREARRVLRDDGTLWLNLGDKYASKAKKRNKEQSARLSTLQGGKANQISCKDQDNSVTGDLKPKDLIGIPWMVAFALRADGWFLRQDIIWSKPNPMPESITDRCTKSHEYIFLLSKSRKYYYNQKAIQAPATESTIIRLGQNIDAQSGSDRVPGKTTGPMKASWKGSGFKAGKTGEMHRTDGHHKKTKSGNLQRKNSVDRGCPEGTGSNVCGNVPWEGEAANKRSVWNVATVPFSDAHFATFPPELIRPCILAGCPPNGVVLDMFVGSGTTAIVAREEGMNFLACDLNPDYMLISAKRMHKRLGLFQTAG